MDLGRAHLHGKPEQLHFRRAVPQAQTAAAFLERAIQVREALEHELRPRTGCVPPVQEPVIEAEDGDDLVVTIHRRAQSRMVMDPQVPPEPDERRQAAESPFSLLSKTPSVTPKSA